MARILGLDIDHDALRGAVVRTAFRRVEVERYVQIPLTEAVGSPGRVPELADAYQNLLRAIEMPPDSVVTAMPGLDLSVRSVSLPEAAAKRIADILPFELETVLPFSPDESVIAHQPAATRDGQLGLMVAAAPEARVEAYLAGLSAAGIDPDQVAAGATALDGVVGLLPELLSTGTQLLLEVRRTTTDICMIADGKCVAARTLSVGTDVLNERSDSLWMEIQRTLSSARAAGIAPADRVYLLGEGSTADGMGHWLSDRLGTDVEALALPAAASGLPAQAIFGRALALAGRSTVVGKHINLRSGRFTSGRSGNRLLAHGNLLAVCSFFILLSMVFSLNAQHSMLLDEQARLQGGLATVTKEVLGREIDSVEAVEHMIKTQKSKRDPLPRFDALDVLEALSSRVPPDVVHEVRRLRIEVADDKRDGRLELQGTLATLEQRDALAAELLGHPCFTELEKGRTTPSRDKSKINYQLEATIHCPGDSGGKKKKKKKKK